MQLFVYAAILRFRLCCRNEQKKAAKEKQEIIENMHEQFSENVGNIQKLNLQVSGA